MFHLLGFDDFVLGEFYTYDQAYRELLTYRKEGITWIRIKDTSWEEGKT